MQNRRVRWAILGTSFISETMAAAIQESSISQLLAVSSRSDEKARLFASQFSIPKVYTNYESLLNDADIDVVYIGLPNHLHSELIVRCAMAGKHVLCEKPLVLNADEAEEAFAAVDEAGVFCLEGLMYRYHPVTQKIQEIIHSGVIGKIKLIHAAYAANIAELANPVQGGAIRNLGCYPLSLTRLLMDAEPSQLTGRGRLAQDGSGDRQASAILTFKNDAMAVVSCADDVEMFWQFDVFGSEGRLTVKTNPWLPAREANRIIVSRYCDDSVREVEVSADKSLFVYQVDVMSNNILGNDSADVEESRRHSVGNAILLAEWLRQVKESACLKSTLQSQLSHSL